MELTLKRLPQTFTVCKLKSTEGIDLAAQPIFVGITDEEISLVCPTDVTPQSTTDRDDGWSAFRICGVLDFSLVGILAKISAVLAESGIGIFAVSTYNTDYVLVKSESFDAAAIALASVGYNII